ncbi:hypothetical protein KI387_026333, partial [Taxus chinensis]
EKLTSSRRKSGLVSDRQRWKLQSRAKPGTAIVPAVQNQWIKLGSASMGGEERILSILLSTSELPNLDLSNLHLFQATADPDNNGFYIDSEADPFSFFREAAGPVNQPEPIVFKSRAVMEAETENKPTRGCRARRPAPMPGINRAKDHPAVPLPEPHQKPRIDLNSSPAAKFLVQVMPWELHPSPVTPFTPAAVPFQWEEAPGKPKPPPAAANRRSPRPALHLPPRLVFRSAPSVKTLPLQGSTEEPGAKHGGSWSSGSAEEKRVIYDDDDDKIAECGVPSHIAPAYDLHWRGKASALVTMWRKKSSSGHNKVKSAPNSSKKKNNNKPPSLNPSGELLVHRDDREVWVNDEATTETPVQSLNAMIAAAMGAKTEQFDYCSSTTKPYARPVMERECHCSKMPRRTKRKWVLRKLRRPAHAVVSSQKSPQTSMAIRIDSTLTSFKSN